MSEGSALIGRKAAAQRSRGDIAKPPGRGAISNRSGRYEAEAREPFDDGWPREDGDLSRWMQWLLTAHVRRYHRHYQSSGHVWQGRFKAFPIQQDEHLFSVLRYVERNPVRAKSIPVRRAERWPWSSIGTPPVGVELPELHPGPVPRGEAWLEWVNQPQTEAELIALRECIARGRPHGSDRWVQTTARRLGLESSLRSRGRPQKTPEK